MTSNRLLAAVLLLTFIACQTPEETLPYLGQAILPGDVALVKGSRVLAMERVVEAMQDFPRRLGA